MNKRFVMILILSVSIVVFSGIAWSSVIGDWDTTVNGRVTVKVPGYGAVSEKLSGYDEFAFYSNGFFESNGMDGTWVQKKKKFTIILIPAV